MRPRDAAAERSEVSVGEALKLVEGMRVYYAARAPWHDSYMGYTGNAALEALLAPIVAVVEELLSGRDVLEVACGTGNWTEVLGRRAASVLATDVNETTLRRAEAKDSRARVASFQVADAYTLEGVPGGFTGAFASDWWSHVPRSLLPGFLDSLHGRLEGGARVVFLDMLPRDHPDLTPYRHDREGNAICRRTLPDGRVFDVVKNFPSRSEALESVTGRGERAEYHEWPELGRWLVTYTVSTPSRS